MFTSCYLLAADFLGKAVPLTISEVLRDKEQMATGQKAEKYTIRFREIDKELILSKPTPRPSLRSSKSRRPSTGRGRGSLWNQSPARRSGRSWPASVSR